MVSMHVVSMQLPSVGHAFHSFTLYSSKKHLARIYHDLDTEENLHLCYFSNLVQILKDKDHWLHMATRENRPEK